MTRVAVILHERLGNWVAQLRPRLHDRPIRWFETRTAADLDGILGGLACPVVLVDLGKHPVTGLTVVEQVLLRNPDAWVLVLDPECHPGAADLARELGATHVISGFVPPPRVAELLSRWVGLALERLNTIGWSRARAPESESKPWGWLADYLGDPDSPDLNTGHRPAPSRPGLPSENLAQVAMRS